ncbi:carboxylate-amine ligase [Saccharothrix variisporea]|uniref:Putative glutamate--cysteine ligase 2 n=1 Tax=Saccharothrix variisporea TaxID=543527 RepID=A0A495X3M7_9PSEU|nr:carboxylate-amine ligase [Saccharothrix variisporea]
MEEEFLLVDAESRAAVPLAREVLARVGGLPGGEVHGELHATQVEFASGVCTRVDELREQLTGGRRRLARAARDVGALLVPAGAPVLGGAPPPRLEDERFGRITELYRGQVADYQCCGCHVHVGVPDRETAVAVLNHLRPWLPTLLALSVNSPFAHGRDTGFGSWRMVEQSRFPGSGVPPRFASAAAYDAAVDRLVACGVVVDRGMSFWLARLSPRYPTVEVRAADTAATVDRAVAQAVLTRALVDRALADLAEGREGPDLDDQVLAAAVWTASRYGLDGPGVDPWRGVRVPATDLVAALARHVGITQVEAEDGGARMQRRLAAGPELSGVRGTMEAGAGGRAPGEAEVGGSGSENLVAVVDALAAACIGEPEPGNPPS